MPNKVIYLQISTFLGDPCPKSHLYRRTVAVSEQRVDDQAFMDKPMVWNCMRKKKKSKTVLCAHECLFAPRLGKYPCVKKFLKAVRHGDTVLTRHHLTQGQEVKSKAFVGGREAP